VPPIWRSCVTCRKCELSQTSETGH
jgi:hypothetical protein